MQLREEPMQVKEDRTDSTSTSLVRKSLWGSRALALSGLSLPFKAAALASSLLRETGYLCDLSVHNLSNTFQALKSFYKGGDCTRPTWNLAFHVLVKTIKSNLEYEYHSVSRLRAFTSFLAEPVPRNVKITPFKFHVNRNILLQYEKRARKRSDEADCEFIVPQEVTGDDEYELHGEWIEWIDDRKEPTKKSSKTILMLHGGAFLVGSVVTHRGLIWRIAKESGARVCAINYRLAPEFPFPAAIHDAFAAYLYLTQPSHPAFLKASSFFSPNTSCHQPLAPKDIIIMGDSAGGGLAAGLMHYLKDWVHDKMGEKCYENVGGAVLLSPWVEISCSTESWHYNYETDYLPFNPGSPFWNMLRGEPDSADITNPYNPSYSYMAGYNGIGWKRQWFVHGTDTGDSLSIAEHAKPRDVERRDSAVEMEPPDAPVTGKRGSSSKRPLSREDMAYKIARHPLASPLFADHTNMPPILVVRIGYFQTGDAEMLRDEGLLYAQRIAAANPELHEKGFIRHELYMDMPHVFQAFSFLSAAQAAVKNIARFIHSLDANTALPEVVNDRSIFAVDAFLSPPPCAHMHKMDVGDSLEAMKATGRVVGAAIGGEILGEAAAEESTDPMWMGEGMLHVFM
ncbi:Alpha/Beta hydrolase protein [Gaertneriomyces semiglobifer]|nr:Alpha/Beta hydrolase protein [Gaertneriomyces semiglobifer]